MIAHADWGIDRRKRQIALARLGSSGESSPPSHTVTSLAPAAEGAQLFRGLGEAAGQGQAMIGFDFPIGLPRKYAEAAGITSFSDFLAAHQPWRASR